MNKSHLFDRQSMPEFGKLFPIHFECIVRFLHFNFQSKFCPRPDATFTVPFLLLPGPTDEAIANDSLITRPDTDMQWCVIAWFHSRTRLEINVKPVPLHRFQCGKNFQNRDSFYSHFSTSKSTPNEEALLHGKAAGNLAEKWGWLSKVVIEKTFRLAQIIEPQITGLDTGIVAIWIRSPKTSTVQLNECLLNKRMLNTNHFFMERMISYQFLIEIKARWLKYFIKNFMMHV